MRLSTFSVVFGSVAVAAAQEQLKNCGFARYYPSKYTCYEGDFLCPVLNGVPTLRCGPDCYLPSMYSCSNDKLVYPLQGGSGSGNGGGTGGGSSSTPMIPGNNPPACPAPATTQHLADLPYQDYFYSDCHTDAQVVVTSPQPDSNLTIIGPRLIVAWPAGNSGVCAFFEPKSGKNGTLGLSLQNFTTGEQLKPVYKPASSSGGLPSVGVQGILRFNSSAVLTVPIIGGVRTIRDFVEGPSLLRPIIQDAIKAHPEGKGAVLSRLWLDNITTMELGFLPMSSSGGVTIENKTLTLEAGDYLFYTDFNYPQLTQLNASSVLRPQSQSLITQQPDQTTSLSFLSYTQKLLAGGWRFLTYFGRDSMITALLMQPVLSEGQGGAIEAVIGAVLERINRTDGSVCHEETLGDYATYLHYLNNETLTSPTYTYPMIDADYYLPILSDRYFLAPEGNSTISRTTPFFSTKAGEVNPANKGLTWGDLSYINAQKLMGIAATFAAPGNQTTANLAHLKSSEIVGEWRDSTYGIGGGRIPYDVNTGLMPAALRSIGRLSRTGVFNNTSWQTLADTYAQVWEDSTLQFFETTVPQAKAQSLVQSYAKTSSFSGPDQSSTIDSDVIFHSIALDGYNNLSKVEVMNTDDCFRLFLVNSTNQPQLTRFLNQSANNIMRTYPAGLLTSIGLLVANPAYGSDPVYAANWTTNAYHGTVVWSWPQAMTAKGLEIQLDRCNRASPPDFCTDTVVHGNVLKAYNALWDVIEKNSQHLTSEVWSWVYQNNDFVFTPLGALPPPPGVSPTESDVVQLWSLTYLAVTRNTSFK